MIPDWYDGSRNDAIDYEKVDKELEWFRTYDVMTRSFFKVLGKAGVSEPFVIKTLLVTLLKGHQRELHEKVRQAQMANAPKKG